MLKIPDINMVNPEYIWSEDNSSCEAYTICENCGNRINEKEQLLQK